MYFTRLDISGPSNKAVFRGINATATRSTILIEICITLLLGAIVLIGMKYEL